MSTNSGEDQYANTTYTYSKLGNLTSLVTANNVIRNYTYTGDNWLDREELVFDFSTWSFDYGYDKLGNLSSLEYPNGHKINYHPNGFGQPTEVSRSGFKYATNVSYKVWGMLASFQYGNGILHQTWGGSDQLVTRMQDYRSGLTLFSQSYGYYENASMKYITDNRDSSYSISELTYDGLDRLISVTAGQRIGNSSLTYDTLGNIKTYVSNGRNLSYEYKNNRLSKVTNSLGTDPYPLVGYDHRGNIIYGKQSLDGQFGYGYVYNLNNQIVRSSGNSYIYDGHKRRVKTIDSNGTTYYIYNRDGKLLYKQNENKGINYIYLDDKLIAQDGVAGSSSSRGIVHTRPFGETIETPKNDIGYTGHSFDNDLALNYMQSRYYDPVIGRFMSNDPVGYTAKNPVMSFNRYLYANNNPYKYVDPTGAFIQPNHYLITYHSAKRYGFSNAQAKLIAAGSWDADVGTQSTSIRDVAYHAMRAPGQSVADARENWLHHIDMHLALGNYGIAAHAVQDSISHPDFPEWRGMQGEFESRPLEFLLHGLNDTFNIFQMFEAYQKTNKMFEALGLEPEKKEPHPEIGTFCKNCAKSNSEKGRGLKGIISG